MGDVAARETQGLPPALPPAERTVGQLVAEALHLYRRRFWAALPLGLSLAVIDQIGVELALWQWLAFTLTIGNTLLTMSYVGACAIAAGRRIDLRRGAAAVGAGFVAFFPFPFLILGFILPGFAWLAFVGLVVPVVVLESHSIRGSFRRAVELARADYVHALAALFTLAVTFFLTRVVLVLLLREQGDQAQRVAAFLADLVLSPIVFLGAALLYFDQEARLVLHSRRPGDDGRTGRARTS